MIEASKFLDELSRNDLNFFSGVPDSLLKEFCFAIDKKFRTKHYVAANEGSAIGIGIGYHLRTKKYQLSTCRTQVWVTQLILISLADQKVYSIPLFLIVGWRGEPNKKISDEPQHITQGKETQNF